MPAELPDDLDAVFRRVLDGVGQVYERELADIDLDRVQTWLSAAGAGVVRLGSPRAARGVVLGALVVALPQVAQDGTPPLRAGRASPRIVGWMTRKVLGVLSDLSTDAPLAVLVDGMRDLDEVTRDALSELMRRLAHRPILWVVRRDAAEPLAEPAPLPLEPASGPEVSVARLLGASDVGLAVPDLAALSGLDLAEVRSVVDRLLAGDVLVRHGRHVLLGDQIGHVGALPGSLSRALQRAIVARLREAGVPAVPLAEMARASVRIEDRRAIEVLADAMHVLSDDDPDAAAVFGLAAVGAITRSSELLTGLTWQLLPLLWQTSRIDEARALAGRVFTERGQGEVEAQVLFWLARFEGSTEKALRLTTTALAIDGVSDRVRVRLLAVHLRLLSTLGRTGEVQALLPDVLARAADLGDLDSLSRLQSCAAIQHFYAGRYREAAAMTATAIESYRASGSDFAEWMPEMIWGPHAATVLGDPTRGLEMVDQHLDRLADREGVFATRFLYSERAQALLALGRLGDASDDAITATTTSRRLWDVLPGAADRLQAIALSIRLKVALHRGEVGDLEEIRRILESAAPPPGSEAAHRVTWWRLLVDEAQSRVSETAIAALDDVAPVSWLDPTDEVLIVRTLVSLGATGPALRLAARASRRVQESGGHPLAMALDDHLGGLVGGDAERILRAGETWRSFARPLLVAAADRDAGEVLLSGASERGVALLVRAHDRFHAHGADRDAWQVRSALRAAGHVIRVERVGERSLLTPAESRVVQRAVRGLAVPAIARELDLSPHTVTTHLRHVYTKLDISSRTELVQWFEPADEAV